MLSDKVILLTIFGLVTLAVPKVSRASPVTYDVILTGTSLSGTGVFTIDTGPPAMPTNVQKV